MFGRLLVAILMLGSPALAGATDLVTEPESALYLEPAIFNGKVINVLGDVSVHSPTWGVQQYGNPEPLPGGQTFTYPAGTDWQVANSTTSVNFYHSPNAALGSVEHTYGLSQNGAAVGHTLPCNTEFDLFLAPLGNFVTPQGSAVAQRFASSGPISKLSELVYKFGLNITYEYGLRNCPLNYAGYLVAITLNSTKGPSMFFQIYLRDSRGILPNNTLCPGYPNSQQHYCFDSAISNAVAGMRQQFVGEGRVYYNFNFLSQVIAAIKRTSDPNIADWSVTGAYMGSLIQGGMTPTSLWDSLVLQAN